MPYSIIRTTRGRPFSSTAGPDADLKFLTEGEMIWDRFQTISSPVRENVNLVNRAAKMISVDTIRKGRTDVKTRRHTHFHLGELVTTKKDVF